MAAVSDLLTLRGKAICDFVISELGNDYLNLAVERAWNVYNLTTDDEDEATDDFKEMIALTALYSMLTLVTEQMHATRGAVQRVRVGSDNTPDITFFDRAKTTLTYRNHILSALSHLQRKNGYAPYLNPLPGDSPFVIARVDMEDDTITDGVYVDEE